MKIYRISTEIYDLVIDSTTVLTKKVMGEDLITLNIVVSEKLDLAIGDFVSYDGVKYEMNRPAKFTKLSEVEYRYEVQFESPLYRLLDKIVMIAGKSEFSLVGECEDFIDLLITNINSIDSGWEKGTIAPPDTSTYDEFYWKNIYLKGNNCKELLDMLASEFLCEWEVECGSTLGVPYQKIHIHERVEQATALSFEVGKGKGLYELTRESVDRENTVTKAYVFGSTNNLPINYRNGSYEPRLVFASRYLTPTTPSEYPKTVEKNVIFEGIYPRFTGTVSTVSADFLTITCTLIDFDLNDCFVGATKGKIVFLSGALSGVEFEMTAFDDATNAVSFKASSNDGYTYPNSVLHAEVNDKFTFTEINMPQSYVDKAEDLLELMGQKWLDYYSQLRVRYALTIDARYIRDNAISLSLGDIVNIKDTTMGIDKDIRITALKISIDGTKISADISNYKDEVWEKEMQRALNDAIKNIALGNTINISTTYNNTTTNTEITNKDGRSVILSGDILWVEGMTFQSTDIEYLIYGVPYTAPAKEITLDDSDPSLSRIDTFIVDVFGNLGVITGTPAENPTSAILDPYQLEVRTVLIGAGATEPTDMNVVIVYDEQAPTEFVTSHTSDANVTVAFDDIVAPRNGVKRIKVNIAIPNSEVAVPFHFIGEEYQGGKIFYLNSGGKSGLIVHEFDTSIDIQWAVRAGISYGTTGATGKIIGTGKANTDLMLLQATCVNFAVKYPNELVVDGYDDWYLPSELELKAIYDNRFKIGGISNVIYWSSTEESTSLARSLDFSSGTIRSHLKSYAYRVRAIRSFDDDDITSGVLVPTYTPTNTILTFASPDPYAVNNGVISMFLKSSVEWKVNSMLLLEAYLGVVKIGSVVISPSTLQYSYKSGDPSWQLIAVPMKNFNCSRATLDGFKISIVGAWTNNIDFGIDVIRYQYSKVVVKTDGKLQIGKRLSPLPDSNIVEFSTPTPYKPGTTKVYADGVQQNVIIDYVEADGKILFIETPLTGEILTCDYYEL